MLKYPHKRDKFYAYDYVEHKDEIVQPAHRYYSKIVFATGVVITMVSVN